MPCTGGEADWFRAHVLIIMKFFYVYILLSMKDRKFYIGFSENPKQRLAEHNAGKNTSTKNRRPLELVFYEAFRTKFDAMRRERYFKTTRGKAVLRLMLKDFFKDRG